MPPPQKTAAPPIGVHREPVAGARDEAGRGRPAGRTRRSGVLDIVRGREVQLQVSARENTRLFFVGISTS